MDNKIKDVFELNHSPMLAVEKGRISYANKAAERLFEQELIGRSAAGLLPDHILAERSPEFVCSALIGDRSFSASVRRSREALYVSLFPAPKPDSNTDFVSDHLMNTLQSSLFNIGLAIDRVRAYSGSTEGAKTAEYLSILSHNYYSLRHALNNLNTAIALKDDKLFLSRKPVDLAQLCSEVVTTVSHLVKKKNITLEFSTPIGELLAYLDPEKTERVILNILCNSCSHTQPGGKVTLRLEKSGDNALIAIDDKGCGIPAELMSNIFSRYEEPLSHSTLKYPSTGGLGLGIAKGITEKHGGAMIIESREGVGTSVRILLPLNTSYMATLESSGMPYSNFGMSMILTELATLLDHECYTEKYMD